MLFCTIKKQTSVLLVGVRVEKTWIIMRQEKTVC